ncbi:cytochrome P450 [Nesidiocoris tenuis]|uniref:Cytochrome P450 n=1 Tax=Nesidiocoris tenuis TaxID=355587 RepID=A0ABN7ABL5_9HEMI|nr:cytochrome P450 [Nesidiocoris tenuis]
MIWILVSVAAVLLLIYDRLKFRHWTKRGVPHLTPIPFFGHYHPVAFGLQPPGMFYDCHLQKHKDKKYFGVYEYHRPTLVLNDLDLVEHVLVKDFSSFANHPRWVIDESSYLNQMTLNLRGNLWRATRYRLTPSFTASKMQLALDRILRIASPNFQEGEFELQDKMSAIAADVIASYFGATIQNKDAFAQAMFEQTYTSPIRHVEYQFLEHFPKLAAWSGMSLFSKKIDKTMRETSRALLSGCGATSEFRSLIEGIKSDGVLRMKGKDFDINGNEEADHVFEATDELLLGQASQFLFAGLDATANTMGFLAYEIAANLDVQAKVRAEVTAALAKHGNQWSYEMLHELTYLQNCVQESMRIHSVKPFLFREATRDYTFPGTNLKIKTGEKVVIPAISFQMDPQHYPEPEKFKPERWSEDARPKSKFTWLPFGEGPRQCLGMRFSIMEMKLVLGKLLTEFEMTISPRTAMPAGHVTLGIVGRLDRPVYVRLNRLNSGKTS